MSVQSAELSRVIWYATRRIHFDILDPAQASAVRQSYADLKHARVERINEDARYYFINKIHKMKNSRNNQGISELNANNEHYLLQF